MTPLYVFSTFLMCVLFTLVGQVVGGLATTGADYFGSWLLILFGAIVWTAVSYAAASEVE